MSLLTVSSAWAVLAADRGVPATIDRRTLAVWFREAAARSVFTVLRPLGRFVGDPAAASLGPRAPLVLVPGLDVGGISWLFLAIFLRRRGWQDVVVIPRGTRDESLADAANALRDGVAAATAGRHPKVDIVAFGTGGLVAGWYLTHHGEDRTRKLITIGTPWRGTRIAVFQRGRAAVEVLPGSHLLDGLVPTRVPTTCLWSPDDPIVVPTASALPDAGVQSVRLEGAGHLEMLLSARVFRAVQAALEQPHGSQP